MDSMTAEFPSTPPVPASNDTAKAETMNPNHTFDLAETPLREINSMLHGDISGEIVIDNPAGAHSVAAGVNLPVKITINGHVGYYAAGMNQQAEVTINGNAGTVKATLTKGKNKIAKATKRKASGKFTLKLQVPRKAKRGPAKLSVKIGKTKPLVKTVTITAPAPR